MKNKNKGCSGGLPSHAFEYIRYNGGIDSADAYPYEGKDNKCRFNPDAVAATVKVNHIPDFYNIFLRIMK